MMYVTGEIGWCVAEASSGMFGNREIGSACYVRRLMDPLGIERAVGGGGVKDSGKDGGEVGMA